jgi:hypothetical protein
MTAPDSASCYFCLEEGSDEQGKPLVRNCACRGDSAGFAHLSCIVAYAKQKSKQVEETSRSHFVGPSFSDPWGICPNCKQSYQYQLSLDLSDAFVSFVEAVYPGNAEMDKIKVIDALHVKINALLCILSDGTGEYVNTDLNTYSN